MEPNQGTDDKPRCQHCGSELAGKRSDAMFCNARCRVQYWLAMKGSGHVVSVRRLKSGHWSVTVHVEHGADFAPGQRVRIGIEVPT